MSGAKARGDAPVAESVSGGGHSTAAPQRDRKAAGGVLKRLKSRRSQVDSRPVTEEDLRTQGGHITPEDVLGLRVATRGLSLPVVTAPAGPVVALVPAGHNDMESSQHVNKKCSRCCRISGPMSASFPFKTEIETILFVSFVISGGE